MFNLLKNSISQTKGPFFFSLATLSTHHPFLLPEKNKTTTYLNWTDINLTNNKEKAFKAYRFLDQQLFEFYNWFKNSKYFSNSHLIITSDHSPQNVYKFANDTFNVPLIISGINSKEPTNFEKRLGALHDLPSTISHLLAIKPHECDQGINLLMSEKNWPQDRAIYSISGESLERVYYWKKSGQALFDRINGQIKLIQIEEINKLQKSKNSKFMNDFAKFINLIIPMNQFLYQNNAYFPPKVQSKQALTKKADTIFVSHRGNTNGPQDPLLENSLNAIDQAINSKFEWIEIDIQITKDGIPILFHDQQLLIGGKKRNIHSLLFQEIVQSDKYKKIPTLELVLKKYAHKVNFLIELKSQKQIAALLEMSNKISSLIKEYKTDKKIIVDSFHTELIASIQAKCDCTTALDLPWKQEVTKKWLDFANQIGMKWIYIHESVFNQNTLELAHANGLKVMVYTVNNKNKIKEWKNYLPDGIITDFESLMR